jgi:hypothetical protein
LTEEDERKVFGMGMEPFLFWITHRVPPFKLNETKEEEGVTSASASTISSPTYVCMYVQTSHHSYLVRKLRRTTKD